MERRIFLLGNFPPRRCGIATFTHDVYAALKAAHPGAEIDVIAMIDPGQAYDFPPEVAYTLDQDDPTAYRAMARRINAAGEAVLCVQHEYGIFGGAAGDYLLELLDAVDVPVVTTLHTVLTDPNPDQRRVLEAIAARSSKLIVMAQKGVDILRGPVWNVEAEKIALIPHGAPDFPMSDSARFKPRFGLDGREVLFTFGLLSPGKGLETVIRAMPRIVAARPTSLYLILGSTHPHLVAREGEAYREGLMALARELGVSDHVAFVDTYADNDALMAYLAAADVYVTPYLNEAQITSGTLTYAVALGKPVISTPYWHAQELLAEERGLLVPFGDSEAIADAAIGLLADDDKREAMRGRAYAAGRTMLWSRLAERYMALLGAAAPPPRRQSVVNLRTPPRRDVPALSLKGVQRLTDDCGMLQHAAFGVPDRNHGYCLDDNARALMLTGAIADLSGPSEELDRLAWTYASFVQHAWDDEQGVFRNFMAYDRSWLEARGSDDSFARGFQAVAATAEKGPRQELRVWAGALADRILPHAARLASPRSQAFVVLGCCALLRAHPGHALARQTALLLGDGLERLLSRVFTDDWRWFEEVLAYDNARLPEALLTAGRQLEQPRLVQAGLVALEWLCRMQTGRDGRFRPVGTESFGRVRQKPLAFDQQPLEAAATIDACAAAFACMPELRWLAEARRAYDWYMGENDLGLRIAQPETGGCYDGLTPSAVNLNQGAESVLSYQWAVCSMQRLARVAEGRQGERASV